MEVPAAATQHLENNESPYLYREDESMTSVVSYPHRCPAWGDNRYRGNCDGRLFKDLVLRYSAKRVADPMMGSGTTRDVIDGINRVRRAGISFWGSDLHEGFDLTLDPLHGEFDFVWLHPPYWNMVRYSDNPRDLSNCATFHGFVSSLLTCLQACHRALVPGGRLAVLVGDVRRQGIYYPLIRSLLCFDGTIGELCSIIIKQQHNCASDRKAYGRMQDVPIKHEYTCVVFKK